MRLLGVVQWTNYDRNGNPIAGVRPLIDLHSDDWRTIDAGEEFPTQGQIFWPNAQGAATDNLIIVHAEPNPGQRDVFRAIDPKPVFEVIDLRRFGSAAQARDMLVNGISLAGPSGKVRLLVWCQPDTVIGPVELSRENGQVKLVKGNLHCLPAFANPKIRSVNVDEIERFVRFDEAAVSGYVDWDDDVLILRRAIDAAARIAKQSGHNAGQTKRQIEEAAAALAIQGVGRTSQLDSYRIQRAVTLLEETDLVANNAATLAAHLCDHPSIKQALEEVTQQVKEKVESSVREDLEQRLATERVHLRDVTTEYTEKQDAIREAGQRLDEMRELAENAVQEVEATIEAGVLAALDRPAQLLAQVSVLRPLLGPPVSSGSSNLIRPSRRDWPSTRADEVKEKASLRRVLTTAARARGVDPSLMLHIHAAIAARLMPVTLGPGALGALAAYADGACAGRIMVVQISPTVIQPQDFERVLGDEVTPAIQPVRDVDGISMVVLEGANRSPLEATVIPHLQMSEIGLTQSYTTGGLRLAATLAVGATTVPVSPHLWFHAVAIHPEVTASRNETAGRGDVTLTSELFALGDEPHSVIESLMDEWPECRELRSTLAQFGRALARMYDEEERIKSGLLWGLILPYVCTALSAEAQDDAFSNIKDADGTLAAGLQRLRRKLG